MGRKGKVGEAKLGANLLRRAAGRFHEDSCTDTDPELFDGVTAIQKRDMVQRWNDWFWDREGTNPAPLEWHEIQIDQWMEYIGNNILDAEGSPCQYGPLGGGASC